MDESATQAFNTLLHSAQADGVIERSTAIWAVKEGRALIEELATLRARLAKAEEVIRPFARAAALFPDVNDDQWELAQTTSFHFSKCTIGHLRLASSWMENGKEEL